MLLNTNIIEITPVTTTSADTQYRIGRPMIKLPYKLYIACKSQLLKSGNEFFS